MVDEIVRVASDAERLIQVWNGPLIEQTLPDTAYVEALGVVVVKICIAEFRRALGPVRECSPEPDLGDLRRFRLRGAAGGYAGPQTARN